MAFVSTAKLGLKPGQRYYGFSVFADDVDADLHNLLDPTTFPTDTADNNIILGDDADIYGGLSGYFVADELSITTGAVFNDINGNGIPDDNEAGISDIQITLYEDVNGNGILDAGTDAQVGDTIDTDMSGNFVLPGLPDNNYIVEMNEQDPDLPAGLVNAPGTNPQPIMIAGGDSDPVYFPFIDPNGNGNGGATSGSTDSGADDGGADGSTDSGTDDGGADGTADSGADDGGADGTTDSGTDDGGADGTADSGADDGGADGTTDSGTDDGGADGTGNTDSGADDGGADGTTDSGTDDGGADGSTPTPEPMTAEQMAPRIPEPMTVELMVLPTLEPMTVEQMAPRTPEPMTVELMVLPTPEPMTAEQMAPRIPEPMTADSMMLMPRMLSMMSLKSIKDVPAYSMFWRTMSTELALA